jgi:tetratricopeptide (TPR) repeat protein
MRPLLALAFIVPTYAFAAGGGDSSPPKTTKTTKECKNSQVWDERKGECVNAQDSKLDDDTLYKGVRELAYAGRYEDAQTVLAAMSDQKSDRVLTYLGFTHRKMGDIDRGMAYYQQAIDKNPDNLLARSYMGQGFLEQGDTDAARAQLNEIQARGGKGGWPEKSLRTALKTGKTYDY